MRWIKRSTTMLARLSSLLLMLGLVLAFVNFLQDNALFTAVPALNWVWSISQALAVEASLWYVFYLMRGTKVKSLRVLYIATGVLLVFTATTITWVEALRQALGITLHEAFALIRVPIIVLTLVRAIVAVGLVVIGGVVEAESESPTSTEQGGKVVELKPAKPRKTNGTGSKRDMVQAYLSDHYMLDDAAVALALGVDQRTVAKYRGEMKVGV